MSKNLVRVTGMWKNTSNKSGIEYINGNFGYAKVLLLPNDRKEKASDPDYWMYLSSKFKAKKVGMSEDEVNDLLEEDLDNE